LNLKLDSKGKARRKDEEKRTRRKGEEKKEQREREKEKKQCYWRKAEIDWLKISQVKRREGRHLKPKRNERKEKGREERGCWLGCWFRNLDLKVSSSRSFETSPSNFFLWSICFWRSEIERTVLKITSERSRDQRNRGKYYRR